MIKKHDEFPEYLKVFLIEFFKNKDEVKEFSKRKIPFLEEKSIIDVINEENGEELIVEYLNRLAGEGGSPYSIEYEDKHSEYIVLEDDKIIYPK